MLTLWTLMISKWKTKGPRLKAQWQWIKAKIKKWTVQRTRQPRSRKSNCSKQQPKIIKLHKLWIRWTWVRSTLTRWKRLISVARLSTCRMFNSSSSSSNLLQKGRMVKVAWLTASVNNCRNRRVLPLPPLTLATVAYRRQSWPSSSSRPCETSKVRWALRVRAHFLWESLYPERLQRQTTQITPPWTQATLSPCMNLQWW